jgi:hypothetical protein
MGSVTVEPARKKSVAGAPPAIRQSVPELARPQEWESRPMQVQPPL